MYNKNEMSSDEKLKHLKIKKLKLLLKNLNSVSLSFLDNNEVYSERVQECEDAFFKHLKKCLSDKTLDLSGLNISQYYDLIAIKNIDTNELNSRGIIFSLNSYESSIADIHNGNISEANLRKLAQAAKDVMKFWSQDLLYNEEMESILSKAAVSNLITFWKSYSSSNQVINLFNSDSVLTIRVVITKMIKQMTKLYFQDNFNVEFHEFFSMIVEKYINNTSEYKIQPGSKSSVRSYLNARYDAYHQKIIKDFIDNLRLGNLPDEVKDDFFDCFTQEIYQLFKRDFYVLDDVNKNILDNFANYMLNHIMVSLMTIWRMKKQNIINNGREVYTNRLRAINSSVNIHDDLIDEDTIEKLENAGFFEMMDAHFLNILNLTDEEVCSEFSLLINIGKNFKIINVLTKDNDLTDEDVSSLESVNSETSTNSEDDLTDSDMPELESVTYENHLNNDARLTEPNIRELEHVLEHHGDHPENKSEVMSEKIEPKIDDNKNVIENKRGTTDARQTVTSSGSRWGLVGPAIALTAITAGLFVFKSSRDQDKSEEKNSNNKAAASRK